MKAFILRILIESNEQIYKYMYLPPLARMPTKVVPNLSGKCINTLALLKAVECKRASHQESGALCQ